MSSLIIIIVAIAVTIKHGTFVIIRGHISKSCQNCEALTHDFLVRQVPSLLIVASLRKETTLTNQNSIQEEIKNRIKSGNACYY